MANLLGGLIEETEANRFKGELIEESEITYGQARLKGFEDDFEFTKHSIEEVSVRKFNKKERHPY